LKKRRKSCLFYCGNPLFFKVIAVLCACFVIVNVIVNVS